MRLTQCHTHEPVAQRVFASSGCRLRDTVASETGRTFPLPSTFSFVKEISTFLSFSLPFSLRNSSSSLCGITIPYQVSLCFRVQTFSMLRLRPCPLYRCPRRAADPLSGDCSWFLKSANLDILPCRKSPEFRMENIEAFSVNLHVALSATGF